jgi:TonB family protein
MLRTANTSLLQAERPETHPPQFSVEQPSWAKVFLGNLKDFLTERPVKIPPGTTARAFTDSWFGAGLMENLKEWFRSAPPAAHRPANSELLIEIQAKPGYQVLWENLRDAVAPRRLPPLRVTSKPVPVRNIWSKDEEFTRAQLLSLLTHALVAILLVVPLIPRFAQQPVQASKNVEVVISDISPYLPKLPPAKERAGGGGGGGEHNPVPASRGKLPKFSWAQFTPPAVKPPQNPKLQMSATVLGPPDIRLPNPNAANYGDPLAKLITESSGPGGGSGIGTGCCGGVGSGEGGGVGPGEGWGTGGGPPHAGTGGYGYPVCIYCPNPTFSDEAVKAKYQGTVLLQAVVTADGRVTNIQVVRGLGLGLDEKAIETVRTWRLKPAIGPAGRPSAVAVPIEVTFRLL